MLSYILMFYRTDARKFYKQVYKQVGQMECAWIDRIYIKIINVSHT